MKLAFKSLDKNNDGMLLFHVLQCFLKQHFLSHLDLNLV